MEIGLLLQMAEDLLKGQGKDKFARGEVDEAVTCQTLTCLPLHLSMWLKKCKQQIQLFARRLATSFGFAPSVRNPVSRQKDEATFSINLHQAAGRCARPVISPGNF